MLTLGVWMIVGILALIAVLMMPWALKHYNDLPEEDK